MRLNAVINMEGIDLTEVDEIDENEVCLVLDLDNSEISTGRKDFIINQLLKYKELLTTKIDWSLYNMFVTKFSEQYSMKLEQQYTGLEQFELLVYNTEVLTMVQRSAAGEGLTEFKGTVTEIIKKEGKFGDEIELLITPEDPSIIKKGKTGVFHEFLRFSEKASEDSVPEGSVLDAYLKEVESVFPEAKKLVTVSEAISLMKDVKLLFRRKPLGKKFGEYDASEHWVPVTKA